MVIYPEKVYVLGVKCYVIIKQRVFIAVAVHFNCVLNARLDVRQTRKNLDNKSIPEHT